MKLTQTIAQRNPDDLDSSLSIEVEYSPSEGVTGIHKVYAHHQTRGTIDITYAMSEHFDHQLDSMIDQIDWNEIYLAYRERSEEEYERRIAS